MALKLFVGGLPYRTTDADLRAEFEKKGVDVISASIVTERETGRSRGFGFVEVADAESVQKSIDLFNNNTDIFGRTLTVSEARPKAE